MKSIHDKVAAKIAVSGPVVVGRVVDLLVEKKLHTRVDLVSNALTEAGKLEKEFKKLKPDLTNFDDNGEKVAEYFSAAVNKQRKENRERFDKLNAALEKALEKDDWEALTNISGNKNADNG